MLAPVLVVVLAVVVLAVVVLAVVVLAVVVLVVVGVVVAVWSERCPLARVSYTAIRLFSI